MTTTPDQARELLDGATPGPWEFRDTDALMNGRAFHLRQSGKPGIRVSATTYGHNDDPELIAAAPDLAQTIAAMEWQWGVEITYRSGTETAVLWFSSEDDARQEIDNPHRQNSNPRLVRRLVGPVDTIEETPND